MRLPLVFASNVVFRYQGRLVHILASASKMWSPTGKFIQQKLIWIRFHVFYVTPFSYLLSFNPLWTTLFSVPQGREGGGFQPPPLDSSENFWKNFSFEGARPEKKHQNLTFLKNVTQTLYF